MTRCLEGPCATTAKGGRVVTLRGPRPFMRTTQKNFLADVQKARVLTVLIFREAAEMNLPVAEAVMLARKYLKSRGYPAPDDPLAFATGGRITMEDGDLQQLFLVRSSGEII